MIKTLIQDLIETLPNELIYFSWYSWSTHMPVGKCTVLEELTDNEGNSLICSGGDVNQSGWHKGSLKHDYFKFNGDGIVQIKTKEQAKEFKQIVINYYTKRKDTL